MSKGLTGVPEPGTPVEMRFTKYDGGPHWSYDLHVIGSDQHGVWVAGWPGDVCTRPGRTVDPDVHWVSLIPHEGDWVATFNEPGGPLGARIYVDVTDTPRWSIVETWAGPGLRMTCCDLDLDVVRRFSGECYVDDTEEFEEHQLSMGYPAEVVAAARFAADHVHAMVRFEAEPFANAGPEWLARCIGLAGPEDLGDGHGGLGVPC